MNPLISIIVTTDNSRKYLPSLLKSIADQNYKKLEIIIVENGSHQTGKNNNSRKSCNDFSIPKILRGKIRIIKLKEELGYCKANNLASKKAKGDYLFFVNDDTILDSKCINHIISSIKKGLKKTVVFQPKILSSKYPAYFEYAGAAGGMIDKYGYCFCRGRVFFTIEEDKDQYDNPKKTLPSRLSQASNTKYNISRLREIPQAAGQDTRYNDDIFWASGAAFFIKKDIFHKFSGFDERFFAYHEETDLCWRLNNDGYRILYIPQAIIYHHGEKSWRKRYLLKIFLIHRNHYWLLAKNNAVGNYLKLLPMKVFLDTASFFWYFIHGNWQATIAAISGFVVGLITSPNFLSFSRSTTLQIDNKLIFPRSIAIEYFIKGKKTYHELLKTKKPAGLKTKAYGEFL